MFLLRHSRRLVCCTLHSLLRERKAVEYDGVLGLLLLSHMSRPKAFIFSMFVNATKKWKETFLKNRFPTDFNHQIQNSIFFRGKIGSKLDWN